LARFGAALRALGRAWRTVHRWWTSLGQRLQHFVENIGVGLAIALLLMGPLDQTAVLAGMREAVLNAQVSRFAGTSLGPDVAFVDIDDVSYATWGYPVVTPRDKLCRLIDFTMRAAARVLVVDIDLTSRDPDTARAGRAVVCDSSRAANTRSPVAGDTVLSNYLHGYMQRCRDATPSCVPIVLSRRLQTIRPSADVRPVYAVRASYLDPVVGNTLPVVWGTVQVGSDNDGVVRRQRLFEPVCGTQPRAIPSTVLLAVALFAPGGGTRTLQRRLDTMQRDLDAEFAPVCRSGSAQTDSGAPRTASIAVDIGEPRHPIILTQDERERTLLFRFNGTERAPVGAQIPASAITDPARGKHFSGELLAGKIVVIGSSARDNADIHRTPVGPMAGSLVALNGIENLLRDDFVKSPPAGWQVALEVASLILAAILFLRLSLWIAFSTTIVLIPASTFVVYVFGNGYWLDAAVPLLGIVCHEVGAHGVGPVLAKLLAAARRGLGWARGCFDGVEGVR
jgi:CHASE2 domain-containing sensor protein